MSTGGVLDMDTERLSVFDSEELDTKLQPPGQERATETDPPEPSLSKAAPTLHHFPPEYQRYGVTSPPASAVTPAAASSAEAKRAASSSTRRRETAPSTRTSAPRDRRAVAAMATAPLGANP